MLAGMVVTTVACNFGLLPPYYLALLWQPLLKKLEVGHLATLPRVLCPSTTSIQGVTS